MKEDLDFDKALRGALAAFSSTKGECPTSDELTQLHAGSLDAARAAELQRHLLRCASCDLLIDRLERFDAVVSDESSIRAAIDGILSSGGRWSSLLSGYWKPALSGALATALLFCVPLFWPRPAPTRTSQSRAEQASVGDLAKVFEIPQDRTTTSGPATLHLGASETSVLLSFFVPMEAGLRYAAVIEDQAGSPVIAPLDISSQSQTGRVKLVVKSSVLRSGSYVVRVVETGSPKTLEALPFAVTR